MRLQLLDIDGFIERNDIKEVTTIKHFKGNSKTDFNPNGLFSEDVFGFVGSIARKKTFGFINLFAKIIHPEAYAILTSIDTDLTKLIIGKQNYVVDNEGTLVKSEDGYSGVYYFVQQFDNIDFNKFKKDKKKEIQYVQTNKDKILIDKILVLPAGIRDIQTSMKAGSSFIESSEINDLYVKIMRQCANFDENMPAEIAEGVCKNIQNTANSINTWIKNQLKGKQGLMRGGLLKKTVDHSGRYVIVPDDTLDMNSVGLSWHVLMVLWEPFVLHYLKKQDMSKTGYGYISQYLKLQEDPDDNDVRAFIKQINSQPQSLEVSGQNYFKEIMKEIASDKQVLFKRDPVESRDSFISAYVRVEEQGYVLKLNSLLLNKNGGDYDGDTCAVFALLTDKAQKEAKSKMNAQHTKEAWYGAKSMNAPVFQIELDAATQIYAATKN